MRILLLLFLGFSSLFLSQKNKKNLDIVSNIEAKVIAMKPLGNNSLAKNLEPFYGFAFGGNLMTNKNFGIGLDFNLLYSNVKVDQKNLYGKLGAPKITIVDLFLTHRENISEVFLIEEMAGLSYYHQTNYYIDFKNEINKNNGIGINLGGKAIYILDPEGDQAVFVSGKFNYYSTNVYNENKEIEKYYNHSIFLSLNVGYRFNF